MEWKGLFTPFQWWPFKVIKIPRKEIIPVWVPEGSHHDNFFRHFKMAAIEIE